MGVKSGSFVSRSGKTYRVEFQGDSVKSGGIKKFSTPPVVISMAAGEHKFCGFKSTTATINILTDEPLIDLYASTITSINVKITEDSECIFNGYVIPFAFDQSYTGKADAVTVQAVDSLTVRKDVTYTNVGNVHGVDKTGREIVQEICKRAGVTKIVQHLNFNDANDVMKNASPLDVMVAQAGFLQDEVSDTDALSAICKFFGYTGHLVGNTLYLYDEYCLDVTTAANIYEWKDADGWTMAAHHTGSSSPLSPQSVVGIRNDISVTIERAYDGIQITPAGSDVSVLLPDVCAEENSSRADDALGDYARVFQNKKDDADYIQYRTPRESSILDLGKENNGVISNDWSGVGEDPVVAKDWGGAGSMLLDVRHFTRSRSNGLVSPRDADDDNMWTDLIEVSEYKTGNMLYLKGLFPADTESQSAPTIVGRQKESTCYSHTNGAVELSLSCILMRYGNWIDIEKTANQGFPSSINGRIEFLRLTCGGKVYDIDKQNLSKLWVADDGGMSYFYTEGLGTTLMSTTAALSRMSNRVIIPSPNDGQLRIEIGWKGSPAIIYPEDFGDGWNIYISALSVRAFGDSINTDCEGLRHSFSDIDGGEYLSVSTNLTTRHSDYQLGVPTGVNARPGVVTSYTWKGSYMARDSSVSIPIAGILMVQLKARYGQPHAAYKVTADGNIKPFAAVEWNGNTYTVEAYDRDLYDDTTTITID